MYNCNLLNDISILCRSIPLAATANYLTVSCKLGLAYMSAMSAMSFYLSSSEKVELGIYRFSSYRHYHDESCR
jgi:hypothetical protein